MPEPAVRRIPLDRRVCVVREDRIDLRPERGAVVGPLIGLTVSVAVFVAVALFAADLSVTVLALMLIPGVILAPFSAMGFLYSVIGAAVVIERQKQSVRFQQGVLGLGLGTVELVPFWKVDRIEVEDCDLGGAKLPARPPLDLRAWEIVLVKTSGKRLPIGQVFAANAPELIDEGFDRALDAAEAIAAMTARPLVITAAVEEAAEQPETAPAPENAPGNEAAGQDPRRDAPSDPRRDRPSGLSKAERPAETAPAPEDAPRRGRGPGPP